MSISVPIGGADGPTSIFLAGKLDMGWLNVFGLVMVILMLIPNIIYAVKHKNQVVVYGRVNNLNYYTENTEEQTNVQYVANTLILK